MCMLSVRVIEDSFCLCPFKFLRVVASQVCLGVHALSRQIGKIGNESGNLYFVLWFSAFPVTYLNMLSKAVMLTSSHPPPLWSIVVSGSDVCFRPWNSKVCCVSPVVALAHTQYLNCVYMEVLRALSLKSIEFD